MAVCANGLKSRFCVLLCLSYVDYGQIDINLNGEKILYANEIKYLGVMLDPNLNFCFHADYIMRKFSKKIAFIYRVGKYLTPSTKFVLYNSIAAPHLEFCSTLLYNLLNYKIQEFQKIQYRGMRSILNCDKFTPIDSMLSILNLLSVNL